MLTAPVNSSGLRLDATALDRRIRAVLERQRPPILGAVLGVSAPDDAPHVLAVGEGRFVDGSRRLRVDDRFLLTSVTKTLTALQLVLLAQDGAVSLTSPVGRYLEEFSRGPKSAVRLWHLLAHCSGLSLDANTTLLPRRGDGPADQIRAALDADLAFRPGTRVEYCSAAYWVVAHLIEVVTGSSHVAHLSQAVLGPLGLPSTRYEPAGVVPPDYVLPVVADHRAYLEPRVRRLCYPAGGLVGTVGDLLRFGNALLGDGSTTAGQPLLSRPALDAIHRTWAGEGAPGDWERTGEPTTWALGWQRAVPGGLTSDRCLWHWGAAGTAVWVDPVYDVVVVVLSATWDLDWEVFGEIANAAFGALVSDRRTVR